MLRSNSLLKKIEGGVVVDIDMEGELNVCDSTCPLSNSQYNEIRNSSRVLTVYQLRRAPVEEERDHEIVKGHYQNGFNATDIEFLNTKTWEYFYKWDPLELAQGNHWKVFNMQGRHRTWYAGASVMFESVKSVMEYNELLKR